MRCHDNLLWTLEFLLAAARALQVPISTRDHNARSVAAASFFVQTPGPKPARSRAGLSPLQILAIMVIASDAKLSCPVLAHLTLPATGSSVLRKRNFRTYNQVKRRTSDVKRAFGRACLHDARRSGCSLRTTCSQHRVSAAVAEQNTATQESEAAEESNQVQAFLQWLAIQGPHSASPLSL